MMSCGHWLWCALPFFMTLLEGCIYSTYRYDVRIWRDSGCKHKISTYKVVGDNVGIPVYRKICRKIFYKENFVCKRGNDGALFEELFYHLPTMLLEIPFEILNFEESDELLPVPVRPCSMPLHEEEVGVHEVKELNGVRVDLLHRGEGDDDPKKLLVVFKAEKTNRRYCVRLSALVSGNGRNTVVALAENVFEHTRVFMYNDFLYLVDTGTTQKSEWIPFGKDVDCKPDPVVTAINLLTGERQNLIYFYKGKFICEE